MAQKDHPMTPDGRYFVSKGQLWRKTDPRLDDSERRAAIKAMMQARRDIAQAVTEAEDRDARTRINAAKTRLGERGPVWWDDGAPDESGLAPDQSSYAEWWAGLSEAERTNA